jgi:hypothetical protein
MKLKHLCGMIAIFAIITLSTCSYSNTSRVTIHLPTDNKSAQVFEKDTFLDKIFSLFNKEAYAQSWNSSTGMYELFITASDMSDPIVELIPGSEVTHQVEVPAGSDRHFILWSIAGTGEVDINWVGRAVANLEAGAETELTITLFPMTTLNPSSYSGIGVFNGCFGPVLTWISAGLNTYSSYFTNFNIYRSETNFGPFELISTTPDLGSPTAPIYSYTDTSAVNLVPYFYFISVGTADGDLGPGNFDYLNADNSEWDFFYYIMLMNVVSGFRDSNQC